MNRVFHGLWIVVLLSVCSSLRAQPSFFCSELNVGGGPCIGRDRAAGKFGIEGIFGVQVNSDFFVGAGIGWQYYGERYEFNEGKSLRTVPFFLDAKGFVRAGKVSPFLAVDVGWGVSFGEGQETLSGFYFAPAVGIEFLMPFIGPMNVTLAYQRQKLRDQTDSYRAGRRRSGFELEAVVLRLGFVFGSP